MKIRTCLLALMGALMGALLAAPAAAQYIPNANSQGKTGHVVCDQINNDLKARIAADVAAVTPGQGSGDYLQSNYRINDTLRTPINVGFSIGGFDSMISSLIDNVVGSSANAVGGSFASTIAEVAHDIGVPGLGSAVGRVGYQMTQSGLAVANTAVTSRLGGQTVGQAAVSTAKGAAAQIQQTQPASPAQPAAPAESTQQGGFLNSVKSLFN